MLKSRRIILPWGTILYLALILAFIQGCRIAAGAGFKETGAPDLLAWDVFQVLLFTLIGVGIVITARLRGEALDFWPDLNTNRDRIIYIGGGLFLVFMIVTSLIMNNFDPQFTVQQLSSVVIVPLVEELIFRGWVWNRLRAKTGSDWVTLAVTVVLFGLWHLGYADSVAFRMAYNGAQGDLVTIMLMKVVIGAGYGLVTGFARMKAKNCSASFLVHAVLNLFGR